MGPAIALAVLLLANSASADRLSEDNDETKVSGISSWLKDTEMAVRVNSDLALRAVVCRVPFMDFTVSAIIRATKIPRHHVLQAVAELQKIGLVKLNAESRGNGTIVPSSEDARKKMRRWVYRWCASDDECGVSR